MRFPTFDRVPMIAFAAASAVALASLVLVRTSDDTPANVETLPEFREDLYEQSIENPLIRSSAPYSEHPEWFQSSTISLAEADEANESSILQQLLSALWP